MAFKITVHTRRSMLTRLAGAPALATLATLATMAPLTRGAAAAGGRVDPASATARALGYGPDGAATARGADAERCGACVQFAGGADWAPCAIFQGCEVNANGWCRAFTAR